MAIGEVQQPSGGGDRRPDDGDVALLLLELQRVGVAGTAAIDRAGLSDLRSNRDLIVFGALERDGPQRPSRLAQLAGMTSGGMANLLLRHESAGRIRRAPSTDDGRGVVVSLTSSGHDDLVAAAEAADAEGVGPAVEQVTAFAGARAGHSHTATPLRRVVALAAVGELLRGALVDAAGADEPAGSTILTLWRASRPDPARPTDLAADTGLTPAGVTSLLDRLEDRGLVTRSSDESDRRTVIVTPTAHGVDHLRELLDTVVASRGEIRALLDDLDGDPLR